jgi:hypothetical protein
MKSWRRSQLCTGTAICLLLLSPVAAQTPAPSQSPAPAPAPTAAGMAGQHTMEGEVTKVDAKKGWIDIKSPEGRMKLHFPPEALQSVKVGDRVSIEMSLKH